MANGGPYPKQPLPHPPRGKEFDEYLLTGFNYDVGTIYTSSSNSKGFSEVIGIRVSPMFAALIKQFHADYSHLGYRNQSDFLRDAVFHRMYQIMHMEDDLQGPVWEKAKEQIILDQLVNLDLEHARGRELLTKAWERVEQYIADGWMGEAEDLIDTVHDAVSAWPKGDRRDLAIREVAEMRKYMETPEARKNVTRLVSRLPKAGAQ